MAMGNSDSGTGLLPPRELGDFRKLGGVVGLWLSLSVGTWSLIHDPKAAWPGRPITPRRPPQAPADLTALRDLLTAVLGATAWAKPPKGTTRRDAIRGFVVSTALFALVLGYLLSR